MSTILLIALFVSLCLMQWFFSKNRISLLSFLPTEFYLLIAGIAAIRTILDGTFSAEAGIMLLLALSVLLIVSFLSYFLSHRHLRVERSSSCQENPASSHCNTNNKITEKRHRFSCAFLINMIVRILLSPRSDAPSAGNEVYTDRTQTAES